MIKVIFAGLLNLLQSRGMHSKRGNKSNNKANRNYLGEIFLWELVDLPYYSWSIHQLLKIKTGN